MYWIALIFCTISVSATALEGHLIVAGVGTERAIGWLGFLVRLLSRIVCGACGNAWYLSYTRRQIAGGRPLGLGEGIYFAALARRGRPGLLAAFGVPRTDGRHRSPRRRPDLRGMNPEGASITRTRHHREASDVVDLAADHPRRGPRPGRP